MTASSAVQKKNRRSKQWNIVLVVLVVFLGIVIVGQLLPGQSPTSPTVAPEGSSPAAGASGDGSGGDGGSGTGAGTAGDSDTAGNRDAAGDSAANSAAKGTEMAFVRRDPNDPMAIGDVAAPVVLVQWTDLRCPYCAVFHRDTLPALIEQYVDTGKVRIEVHDVGFFGAESEKAAVAARAAGNQGMFAQYLTAVYDVAPEGAHADLPRDTLIAFAEQIGVPDMAAFVADLDDPQLLADAQASTTYAQQIGVTSVPFFVAGETALAGAQPIAVFQEFLDAALVAAG